MTYHDETFNYVYIDNFLYVGGSDVNEYGNGAYNKDIVEAILPKKYQNVMIYGTAYRCLGSLPKLKKVFVPRTYKFLYADFCKFSSNVESITFEDNSELDVISGWVAYGTLIKTFVIPSNVKALDLREAFGSCKNIETIYYAGKLKCNDLNAFVGSSLSSISVYTRENYGYNTFCNASVVKVLSIPKKFITCKRKQESILSRTSLMMFIYVS